MSQDLFARVLNMSTKTIQSWEDGTRKPSQAALRLIQVFLQNPSGVLRAAGMAGSPAKIIPESEALMAGTKKRRPSKTAT